MFKALKKALGLGAPALAKATTNVRVNAAAKADVAGATQTPSEFALGNAAVAREDFEQAAKHYANFVKLEPRNHSGYIGLGFARLELRQFPLAIDALRTAASLDPANADALYMLGKALSETGQLDEAESAWHKAHALAPTLEHLYADFCILLFKRGKLPDARRLLDNGIARFPRNGHFRFLQGNVFAEGSTYAAAAENYRQATALGFAPPQLYSNLGTALVQTGDLEGAIEVLKKARELAPDDAAIASSYLLAIQYSPSLSREEKFEAHRSFSQRFEAPLMSAWTKHTPDLAPERKLRLGYVSGDFRNHSLAFFIEPILAHHDRSRFEVFCYYTYPVRDAVTLRLEGMTDSWLACDDLSDEHLAARIRADKIDILIDLSGHTGHNRLLTFARKPAPIQMTWLGYQATTGLQAMDYRITDEALDPTGSTERFHSERLLRLPAAGTFSPASDSPPVNELPALAGHPFTFGCLNNPSKITDQVIRLWATILGQCPQARLLIGNATDALADKFSAQFEQHGGDPRRLDFQPKVSLTEYLALHHHIDLALDTFPYNGGTTSFHSLWMGVPMIALEGETALSNAGVSVLRGMGLPAFCASTEAHYVERAVHYAGHLEELAAVRRSLRERVRTIADDQAVRVTASLEGAIQACRTEHRRGAASP